MANYLVTDTQLTSVANAIRAKTGDSSGLSFPDGMISAVGNISTGGGSTNGDVIFIDYDGTIVDAKTKTEINAMTSDSDLPANPTHTGLTAQGWNWTVAQLKAQLTAMPNQKVYVGQMYVTTSGDTEIDVEMLEGRLSPIMTIAVNGEVSVDWGDNTTPDTVTGTSLSSRLAVGPHNYAAPGNYMIKVSVVSGQFAFPCNSASYYLLRKNDTGTENQVYANCIKRVRFGSGITSLSNAFYYCYSLSSVTIPDGVTSIGSSLFYNCYSLSSVTIPSSVTSIGSSVFYNCYSLSSITIPSGVTIIDGSAFYSCYSLSNIVIPNTVTNIGSSAFNYCSALSSVIIPSSVTSIGSSAFSYCSSLISVSIPDSIKSINNKIFYYCSSLSSITIPDSVTSIGNSVFQGCFGISEIHILPETVPTLGTDAFKNISSDCIIYVPYSADHSILNAYKTASNWSTYASYMQEEPQ